MRDKQQVEHSGEVGIVQKIFWTDEKNRELGYRNQDQKAINWDGKQG
jgi:hypothetical protein